MENCAGEFNTVSKGVLCREGCLMLDLHFIVSQWNIRCNFRKEGEMHNLQPEATQMLKYGKLEYD